MVVTVGAYKSQSSASSGYGGSADSMAFGSKLPPVAILSYVNEAKEDGSFHYRYFIHSTHQLLSSILNEAI
jgi:hypothetical protein